MGRIISVRPGQPVPTQDTNISLRMTKLVKPTGEVVESLECEECVVEPTGLFWQDEVTEEFDVTDDLEGSSGLGEGRWVSHFDNADWEDDCGETSWTGTVWTCHGGWPFCSRVLIDAIGSWKVGYRPTKMRLNISPAAGDHLFIKLNGVTVAYGSYVPLADIDLSLVSDITTLGVYFAADCLGPYGVLSQIEFWEQAGEPRPLEFWMHAAKLEGELCDEEVTWVSVWSGVGISPAIWSDGPYCMVFPAMSEDSRDFEVLSAGTLSLSATVAGVEYGPINLIIEVVDE